jgi:5-formyltetrahydrofolate cyclo-ligase
MTKEELRKEFYRIRKEEYKKAQQDKSQKIDDEFEAVIRFAEWYSYLQKRGII